MRAPSLCVPASLARALLFIALLLAGGLCPRAEPAVAQSTLAAHQAPATAPTAPAAKPSAIIPGSPLAALTGAPAASPPDPDASTPTPFGTNNFGTTVLTKASDDATHTVGVFFNAVRKSTELTPVWHWLQSFGTDATRRRHALDGAKALCITVLPAVLVEVLTRLALRRPKAAVLRRAQGVRLLDLPAAPGGTEKAEAGETELGPRRRLTVRAWLRRFGLACLYIALALLPLALFVVVMASLLNAGPVDTRPARLIATGVANGFLACRLMYEILRFILAPHAADLRLIHTTDARARWLVRALTTFAIVAASGFALLSTAEILQLPRAGAMVLTLDIGLVLHIQAAVLVWHSRRIVAGWIRGKPGGTSVTLGVRNRLAAIWQYVALFYILALWVALAGGVPHAFAVLLRVVLVFVAALIFGRLLWVGSAYALDRLFADSDDETRRHPELRARARVYHPLVKILVRIIIFALVIVFMLQGWGVAALPWVLRDPLSRSLVSAFISIIITIAVALVLWEGANALINGQIDRLAAAGRTRQASRLRTLLPMLKASLGVAIFLVAGLICLSKIGVNAAPLLAGAGVLGIAIGFGSQKLVQDIITGLFLLLEDAMQVGDVVSLAGMSGTVERLSIRTIRLRGGDGSINIIPFSAVTTVTNQTRDFGYAQISIQVGYEEDLPHVYAVMKDIAATMRAEPGWGAMMRDDLQIFGLDQFGASALVITGQIRTGPGQHWSVRREYYARLKARFEHEHIDMPYAYLPPPPPPVAKAEDGRLPTEI